MAPGEGQWRGRWSGWDDLTQFPAFVRQHWEKIRSRLMAGTYHPAPVRRVFIPSPTGTCALWAYRRSWTVSYSSHRTAAYAAVRPALSSHSYGFRYGKRAHQAVRSVQEAAGGLRLRGGLHLKSFFDTVKFDRLMRLLARRVFEQTGAPVDRGLPARWSSDGGRQGGSHDAGRAARRTALAAPGQYHAGPLDKELERRGLRFARYADDFLILVKACEPPNG